MPMGRTRRQRLLSRTLALGAAFLALAGVALWLLLRPGPTYRPGEEVEGLTAQLARFNDRRASRLSRQPMTTST